MTCRRTPRPKASASNEPFTKGSKVKTKLTALIVALLTVAALSGCDGNPQPGRESAASEASSPTTTEESTTTGARMEESGETATLEIEGSAGTEVSGSCIVGDGEPDEISGQVPQNLTYDLDGKPLKCEIASEDDVEVGLTAAGTRSVQRFSGGTLNLTYENGSISSSTSSSAVSSQSSSRANGAGASGTTDGSGNVASEPRDVSGFDEVELRGVGTLSIRQTGSESLTVEAEEGVLAKIGTEVVNGRLVIGPEPDTTIRTTGPINYELTVGDLRALEVSGSGGIDAKDISTEKLATTISGSGTIEISGKVDSQQIDVSGSGDYRAEALESKEAKIAVEGAGSAVVNVSEALDAEVGGAGSVEYVGAPTIDQDVSGAGRVSEH